MSEYLSLCSSAEENHMPEIVTYNNNENNIIYSGFAIPTSSVLDYNTYANYSVNSLLYNTTYGTWSDTFKAYNCYAFVLGKNTWSEIGDFSNNKLNFTLGYNCNGPYIISLNNSINELANYVKQDLKHLGYECVNVMKNWFHEPYSIQRLFCVRKSKNDFHFMKYDNGEWLHKPGNTWVLKYNSIPNENDDWIVEYAYQENGIKKYERPAVHPYTGDIYFIAYSNSHNYDSYQYYNKNEHSVICNNCSSTLRIESHTFKFYKPKAKICSGCGYILYDNGLGQIIMKEDDEKI